MSAGAAQGANDLPPAEATTGNVTLTTTTSSPASLKDPYCALSSNRRRCILTIVTVAGALGPLAGNIYLPALPVLQQAFGVGPTAINATVSLFMIVFAFAVSRTHHQQSRRNSDSNQSCLALVLDQLF